MQDKLIIKYIKKRNEKGMEILIDQYNSLITSVVRYHLGILINYEEECVSDTLLAIWDNIDGFEKSKNSFLKRLTQTRIYAKMHSRRYPRNEKEAYYLGL